MCYTETIESKVNFRGEKFIHALHKHSHPSLIFIDSTKPHFFRSA